MFTLSACQGTAEYRTYGANAANLEQVSSLSVPASLNVLYIDGEKYQGPLYRDQLKIKMLPGTHELMLEYEEIWDLTADEHERVTSSPVLLEFKTSLPTSLIIKLPLIKDVQGAKRFAKHPTLSLFNKNTGQKVASKTKYKISQKRDFSENAEKPTEMIRYWWQKLNTTEKNQFLDWANKNINK